MSGVERVRRARNRHQPWPMIWAWTLAVIRQAAEAVVSVLFLVALGCLTGIGFGLGMRLYFMWI